MTTRLSTLLPWIGFDGPGTVRLADGGYMRTVGFRGMDVTAVPLAERVLHSERLNRILHRSGNGRWSWHIESQNVAVSGYPEREWPTAASRLLDATRSATFNRPGVQYEMRHWASFSKAAPSALQAKMRAMLVSGSTDADHERFRMEFERESDELVKQFGSVLRVTPQTDDDIATYLQSTVSTRRHRVRAADHPHLAESLGSDGFASGIGLHRWGNCYAAVLTLGGFPRSSNPQLLADLAMLPFEFRHVVRCVALDYSETKRLMKSRADNARGGVDTLRGVFSKKLAGLMHGADAAADYKPTKDVEFERLGDEAEGALADLSEYGYVNMTSTFIVWDRDKDRCYQKLGDLRRLLERHQLVVREEKFEPVKPFLMSLPGVTMAGRRTYAINTRSVVDMCPLTELWQGNAHDAQLAKTTGISRAWMYTADPVPFRFNTDVPGGGAHTVVFGQTGRAGKSTLANHMGKQFLGWPGAKVVSISVGRSELGPVLLNDGAAYRVGDQRSHRFQPLAAIDTPEGLLEASEWLQVCLVEQGLTVSPDDVERLREGLRSRAADIPARRTMTAFVGEMWTIEKRLAQALTAYTSDGDYGHIFDGNDAGVFAQRRWTMFDIAPLLKLSTKALVPAVAHMLNLIDRWITGSPLLILCDEFPRWAHYLPLQKFVIRLLDVERKNNVRALLVCQTPNQLTEFPRLLASIQSGCATAIFAPEGRAMQFAEAYAKFGVNEVECERIAKAALGTYLLKNEFGTRLFDLKASPIALALTGMSQPDELALLERLHAECEGDSERMLIALMRERGFEQKAKELLAWTRRAGKAA